MPVDTMKQMMDEMSKQMAVQVRQALAEQAAKHDAALAALQAQHDRRLNESVNEVLDQAEGLNVPDAKASRAIMPSRPPLKHALARTDADARAKMESTHIQNNYYSALASPSSLGAARVSYPPRAAS